MKQFLAHHLRRLANWLDPPIKFQMSGKCDISEMTRALENIRAQMKGGRMG